MEQNYYKNLMRKTNCIALATSAMHVPNVRIVNFVYDEQRHCIQFATFKDNDKVVEMSENPQVAFTTIPLVGNGHAKGNGTVIKSSSSIYDCAEAFIEKIPEFEQTIAFAGDQLQVYEIELKEVLVVESMSQIYTLDLDSNIA